MTPEQFCYWLQGLFECKPVGESLTLAEMMSIRDHLLTVFQKRTPDRREQRRERQITDAISRTKRVC
jgi:hypothetical protein